MTSHIDRLISIAQDISLTSEAAQLSYIKQRLMNENCELILPLVGEFSAGKTTLINSLTDAKQLETATKPTTATIFEIHFGCDSCYAEVYDEQGGKVRVDDVSSLKNENLGDSLVVNVFDTSKRIPSNIVLVDTPGLSSEDPRHRQTLIDFLPNADGILLVVDINQQITRSLTDFINMMNMAQRPVFLVLTKCDTKAATELESAKQYIADNSKLPLSRLVCVSAAKGDVEELGHLLDAIQAEKGKILEKVNEQRLKDIVKTMVAHIDELVAVSSSDKELESAIREKEQELKKIDRTIDRLIDASRFDIESVERDIERKFQDTAFERLDAIAASKSSNFNGEAVTAINNMASICLNDFKNGVERIIAEKARQQKSSGETMSWSSLQNIDTSQLDISGLTFDLDLNAIGHEYDGAIATGVKVAAAAAAVAAVVATAGGAAGVAGAAGAAEAGGAAAADLTLSAGGMLEAADIATDVGSIVSNQRHISRVQQAVTFVGKASEQYGNIEQMNVNAGQQVGANKGLVEGLVGFVTDKAMGKPQRRRAIREYIDGTLTPQFKRAMGENSRMVIEILSKKLHDEALVTISEKKQALEALQQENKEKKESYQQRVETLRDYQNELLTL
ncbi:MAG: dynamin family protein [Prevotella sp.]|nr:dynamin family protein [Prevotella sp.]